MRSSLVLFSVFLSRYTYGRHYMHYSTDLNNVQVRSKPITIELAEQISNLCPLKSVWLPNQGFALLGANCCFQEHLLFQYDQFIARLISHLGCLRRDPSSPSLHLTKLPVEAQLPYLLELYQLY